MLLTGLVVGATLVTGVEVMKRYRAKPTKPTWAERLAALEDKRQKRGKRTLSSLTLSEKSVFEKVNLNFWWPENTRHQQLKELSGGEDVEISEAEKKINRSLAMSLGALGLTSASMFYAPLYLLSLPALIIAFVPFVEGVYHSSFKEGRISATLIETLCVVGTIGSGAYFTTSLVLSVIYFGHKVTIKTEDHASKKLTSIFAEQPRLVWIQKGDIEIEIPFSEVKISDIVIVNAGQTIPVDGIIVDGIATVDQRALTGESQPVEKSVGAKVLSSTIVLSGHICIEVEKAGSDTVAAQIGEILSHTTDFKSSVQSRGQKIVDQGATPTLALSALALPLLGTQSALAVLFASFGYHMRLAAPIGVLNFLNITSQNGILIKDGRSLELLSQIDTVVFDKTGTLTEEVPTVGQIYTCHQYDQNQLLTVTAAAERKQSHPIAQAILNEANLRELALPPIHDAEYEVGYGLKVRIEEQSLKGGSALIRVGSDRFMAMEGISIPAEIEKIKEACHTEGHTLIYVAINDHLGGAIELVPTLRPEARQITRELRKRNIRMAIISGDHQKPTQKLAQSLGIDDYFAEVLPQDKATLIEQLQQEGKSVCFIGDGINDSIALKKANVSISMRGASTAATDSAAIILMDGTLNKLIPLLDIANNLDRNLTRSTIMTVLPGVICVGGVFFFHFGLISAMMLYSCGLVASISNAMWPLFKYQ